MIERVPSFKILDLFCGAGGFSYGMEKNPHFKTVISLDNDPSVGETFKKNMPNCDVRIGDITDNKGNEERPWIFGDNEGYEPKPIPLTPEILEKNGWWYDGYDIWQHKEVSFCIEKSNGRFQCYDIKQIKLDSVHQLQQILRLCGLEELANNFKI